MSAGSQPSSETHGKTTAHWQGEELNAKLRTEASGLWREQAGPVGLAAVLVFWSELLFKARAGKEGLSGRGRAWVTQSICSYFWPTLCLSRAYSSGSYSVTDFPDGLGMTSPHCSSHKPPTLGSSKQCHLSVTACRYLRSQVQVYEGPKPNH